MPIHVYDVATSRPLAVLLRPGKTPSGPEVTGPFAPARTPYPAALADYQNHPAWR